MPDARPVCIGSESAMHTMLYDPVLRRPGCVLLQAVAGCSDPLFNELFGGADDWLIAPTPDMKIISGTREQWENEVRAAALGQEQKP